LRAWHLWPVDLSSALADCAAQLAEVQNAAKGITLSVAQGTYRVGSPIAVSWRNASVREPLSLPILFRCAAGRASTVLAFRANRGRGAARHRLEASQARTFVPIHRNISAAKGGEINVIPYRRGRQSVSWAVATTGECGEHVFGRGQQIIDVAAGNPALVIQDRFTTEVAKHRIRSKSGTYDLLIFDGRYEVHNSYTGTEVKARSVGPISPTGRYMAAAPWPVATSKSADLVRGK
jgi:hypothetical protein